MRKKENDLVSVIKHVWSEPKALVALHAVDPDDPDYVVDPDWWEPRYDQPWRRQMVRDYKAGLLPSRSPVVRPMRAFPRSVFDEIAKEYTEDRGWETEYGRWGWVARVYERYAY